MRHFYNFRSTRLSDEIRLSRQLFHFLFPHVYPKKRKGAHYLIYYNLNVMQSQQEFLNFFSESKNYDICTKAAWLSAVSLSKIPNKAARRAALFQFLTVLLVHFWKAEHSR